jgi:Major Facilitator Superfamily
MRVILDRTRGGSYVAVGITGISLFGIFLFLTFYMQQVKGYSPLTTGLLFLPLVAGILVASTLYSALPPVGPRLLVTAGMLLGAGGTAYLAQLTVTSSYLGGVLPPLIIMGLGFGLIFASAVNSATAGVPARRRRQPRRPTATPLPSRSRPPCLGSARSSRSSCCPHGSGLKNSPAKPRPSSPSRNRRDPRPPFRRSAKHPPRTTQRQR